MYIQHICIMRMYVHVHVLVRLEHKGIICIHVYVFICTMCIHVHMHVLVRLEHITGIMSIHVYVLIHIMCIHLDRRVHVHVHVLVRLEHTEYVSSNFWSTHKLSVICTLSALYSESISVAIYDLVILIFCLGHFFSAVFFWPGSSDHVGAAQNDSSQGQIYWGPW